MTLLLAEINPIVHANAALNTLAAVLLIAGYVLIKQRREVAHKRAMLLAFAVSTVFLICYAYYHTLEGHVKFTQEGLVRYVYWAVLGTHIILAAAVPFLAIATIYLGHRALGCGDREESCSEETQQRRSRYRQKHRTLARITFPIWLYVSITGVAVYLMLYHLWPPAGL